jgi:hypothetical protein
MYGYSFPSKIDANGILKAQAKESQQNTLTRKSDAWKDKLRGKMQQELITIH